MIEEALICMGALRAWRDHGPRLAADGTALAPSVATGDMMSLQAFVEATETLAVGAARPSLGWAVGEASDLRVFGPLGLPVLGASTLGLALRRLCGYFTLVQDATELSMRREDDACVVSYRILDPGIWPRHQDALFTMALIRQLIQRTGTASGGKLELALETGDPQLIADLGRRTGLTCTGGHDANLLRFPAAWLDLPLRSDAAGAPPADCSRLNSSVAQRRRSTGIALRVRSLIYQHLGVRAIDQEDIATQLGMSGRTLRRRLANADLSFQQIVDDCRMRQAAHEFCRRGHISIAQTALRLGYSEHSTFTRAFSRWSGMPPQQYIRAAGHAGPAPAERLAS